MMKYYAVAVKNNISLTFGSRAERDKYITANPNYSPAEHHVWVSDEMRIVLGSPEIIAETGIEYPLEEAIKRNWEGIVRAARMFGVSGYMVRSVRIQRHATKCVITIKGWDCSEILVGFDPTQDWSEEKLMTRTVTFDGVEDGDLHADDFMVDLVRTK